MDLLAREQPRSNPFRMGWQWKVWSGQAAGFASSLIDERPFRSTFQLSSRLTRVFFLLDRASAEGQRPLESGWSSLMRWRSCQQIPCMKFQIRSAKSFNVSRVHLWIRGFSRLNSDCLIWRTDSRSELWQGQCDWGKFACERGSLWNLFCRFPRRINASGAIRGGISAPIVRLGIAKSEPGQGPESQTILGSRLILADSCLPSAKCYVTTWRSCRKPWP